jgi:hypothetical protein
MENNEFVTFAKIPRLSRDCIITEKLDGTNAQIFITEDGQIKAGSRNRWIRVGDDNYGFARWVADNERELIEALGPGRHFGEWWGQGIQRGYGLKKKVFSLFNTSRWVDLPFNAEDEGLIHRVPALCKFTFGDEAVEHAMSHLREYGSVAAPGFRRPEGIVIFHTASGTLFKKTLENDDQPKGKNDEK